MESTYCPYTTEELPLAWKVREFYLSHRNLLQVVMDRYPRIRRTSLKAKVILSNRDYTGLSVVVAEHPLAQSWS